MNESISYTACFVSDDLATINVKFLQKIISLSSLLEFDEVRTTSAVTYHRCMYITYTEFTLMHQNFSKPHLSIVSA